jgi:hypothetical protein
MKVKHQGAARWQRCKVGHSRHVTRQASLFADDEENDAKNAGVM